MKKKDKIKLIAFGILAVILISALLLFDKDAIEMKYISGFCMAAWLSTMFIVNRKYK